MYVYPNFNLALKASRKPPGPLGNDPPSNSRGGKGGRGGNDDNGSNGSNNNDISYNTLPVDLL